MLDGWSAVAAPGGDCAARRQMRSTVVDPGTCVVLDCTLQTVERLSCWSRRLWGPRPGVNRSRCPGPGGAVTCAGLRWLVGRACLDAKGTGTAFAWPRPPRGDPFPPPIRSDRPARLVCPARTGQAPCLRRPIGPRPEWTSWPGWRRSWRVRTPLRLGRVVAGGWVADRPAAQSVPDCGARHRIVNLRC